VIANGADVAILALAFAQGHMLAARLAEASIVGAIVTIVAGHFVHITVAIVVLTVASLCCGNGGIAGRESLICTEAFAQAESIFVFDLAWSPEGEGDRLPGAWALPCIGHALQCVDSIDCDCR